MDKIVVTRSTLFVFVETIISMISGYGFWFIISKLSSTESLGVSSTMISLTTVFVTFASLGIPLGVQRFLGKNFHENMINDAIQFIKTSIILTLVGTIMLSSILFLLHDWLYKNFDIGFEIIIVSVILLLSTGLMTLFRAIVISTLQTKMLPIIMIIASLVKILVGIVIVSFENTPLGIIVGYTFFPVLGCVIYFIVLGRLTGFNNLKFGKGHFHNYREILMSSTANWIPNIVYTIGTQLGTLLIFGSHGAVQAGVYFISFSLFMAITASTSSLFSIAYPLLSSMEDGRKRFSWRTIKMSLILSTPFSLTLMYYSKNILSIFGSEYSMGSDTLVILLLSVVPLTIVSGISNLVYSYGNYKQVLGIGLASNIPRATLYFSLVPLLEGIGAALSYTIGSIIGLIVSLIICKQIDFKILWKTVIVIVCIPLAILIMSDIVGLPYLMSLVVSIVFSYICYLMLGVITRQDLDDSMIVLPKRIYEIFHFNVIRQKDKDKI